jgi:hypothetical protein
MTMPASTPPAPQPPFVPSDPKVSATSQVYLLIRYTLVGLSVLGIGTNWHLSDNSIAILAQALVEIAGIVGPVIWALIENIAKARRAHEGAVHSADVGQARMVAK